MRYKMRLTAPWRRRRAVDGRQAASGVPVDEAAALAAARRGDLQAWAQLIRWHQELVFRSAYLATGDTAMAVETTTHVFVHAFRSLYSLGPDAGFRPWLLRLTDNSARTRLREMTQMLDAGMLESAPVPQSAATPFELPPGTPTPMPAEVEALIEAFVTLPNDDGNAIAARYAFGFGRDAAAARMGIEPSAFDGLLATAMTRLRSRAVVTMPGFVGHAPETGPDDQPSTPGRAGALSDDQLGSLAVTAVLSELRWTPDVTGVVSDRLQRQSEAYPEIQTWALGAASTSARERTAQRR